MIQLTPAHTFILSFFFLLFKFFFCLLCLLLFYTHIQGTIPSTSCSMANVCHVSNKPLFLSIIHSIEQLVWHRWCVQAFQLFKTKNFLIGHRGKVGHHSRTGLRENLGWEPTSQRIASLQHVRTSISSVCLLLQRSQSIQSLSLTYHPNKK